MSKNRVNVVASKGATVFDELGQVISSDTQKSVRLSTYIMRRLQSGDLIKAPKTKKNKKTKEDKQNG